MPFLTPAPWYAGSARLSTRARSGAQAWPSLDSSPYPERERHPGQQNSPLGRPSGPPGLSDRVLEAPEGSRSPWAELLLPSGGCALFLRPRTDPTPGGRCAFGAKAARPGFRGIGGAAPCAATFGRSGEFTRRNFSLARQAALWACQAQHGPPVTLEPQIRNPPFWSMCSMQYLGRAYT